jgi:hypothetical protein
MLRMQPTRPASKSYTGDRCCGTMVGNRKWELRNAAVQGYYPTTYARVNLSHPLMRVVQEVEGCVAAAGV